MRLFLRCDLSNYLLFMRSYCGNLYLLNYFTTGNQDCLFVSFRPSKFLTLHFIKNNTVSKWMHYKIFLQNNFYFYIFHPKTWTMPKNWVSLIFFFTHLVCCCCICYPYIKEDVEECSNLKILINIIIIFLKYK